MNKYRNLERFWFNDRALYRQWPFWVGLGVTLLPLLFGAWRILSPYEAGSSPEAVLFFFEQLQPLMPWFGAVIAVAVLLARMHATVQTEAQIGAAENNSTFSNYLQHRTYFENAIKNIPELDGRSVDLNRVYRCLFEGNGPTSFSVHAVPIQPEGITHVEWMDAQAVQFFDRALNRNKAEGSESWRFDYFGFERNISLILKLTGIQTLTIEEREAEQNKDFEGIYDRSKKNFAERRFDLFNKISGELAYLSSINRPDILEYFGAALFQIKLNDGFVDSATWSNCNYSVEKFMEHERKLAERIAEVVQ